MPTWLSILLGFQATLSFGLLVYWSIVAYHVVRTMRIVPGLPAALEMPESALGGREWPSLCIVVPAHNEERGIDALLQSLLTQDYPNFRVVFALDRCTDRTEEILIKGIGTDPRFEIVRIESCPEGWVGKVHAIWSGVNRAAAPATAELLLFLDADTFLKPTCLRAAVTLLDVRDLQMLSLMSTLTADEWFEKIVQPAAAMELLRQYPIHRANSREDRRPFANGQFILVRRAAYESIKGHEAVKHEVLEDVWLARHLSRQGHHTGLFLAAGLLTCRMYNTWATFTKGWRRIFGECANRKPQRLWEAAWRLRFINTILPLIALSGIVTGAIAAVVYGGAMTVACLILAIVGSGVFFGVVGYVFWYGSTPVLYTPTYIAGAWMAGTIMLEAARDLRKGAPTQWGGKSYKRDVR